MSCCILGSRCSRDTFSERPVEPPYYASSRSKRTTMIHNVGNRGHACPANSNISCMTEHQLAGFGIRGPTHQTHIADSLQPAQPTEQRFVVRQFGSRATDYAQRLQQLDRVLKPSAGPSYRHGYQDMRVAVYGTQQDGCTCKDCGTVQHGLRAEPNGPARVWYRSKARKAKASPSLQFGGMNGKKCIDQ